MKKILVLIGLIVSVNAFSQATNGDEIINALKQGNAEQFSNFFDNFVDLKLPEKDEIRNLGKTQAGIAMKNFFDANKIKGFELISEREMGGTMYMAGKMDGVKNYNLTLMIKSKTDQLSIITI